MRRLHLALLSASALVLPIIACEDGNSSSSGNVTLPEGGGFETGPGQEAGPVPEGGADVVVDNFVPPTGAKITVRSGPTPQQNVRIIAHDATGAVTSETKTDATGVASFAKAPSMITVLSVLFGSPSALTYVGVADGDVLNAEIPPFGNEPPSVGIFTASINAFAGGTFYQFNVGESCGNSSNAPPQPTNITLYDYCLHAQNSVLATVYGDGPVLGFGFLKNQAKPAAGATVVLPTMTAVAAGTLTMNGTNLPANNFFQAQLRSISNSVGYFTDDANGALEDGGFTVKIAPGFADAYQSLVIGTRAAAGPNITRGFLRREVVAGATPALAYDFNTLPPAITNGVTGGAVPARSDVTLTADASLAATDGGIVRLRWGVAGGAPNPQWSFVVPPGTTTFKVPALPNDDAGTSQFLPTAGVIVRDAIFIESTLVPGYAQLKALPISINGEPPVGIDVGVPLPLNGVVKITSWNRVIIPIPG